MRRRKGEEREGGEGVEGEEDEEEQEERFRKQLDIRTLYLQCFE